MLARSVWWLENLALLTGESQTADDCGLRFVDINVDRNFHVHWPFRPQSLVKYRRPARQVTPFFYFARHILPGEQLRFQQRQNRGWIVERDQFTSQFLMRGAKGEGQDFVQE